MNIDHLFIGLILIMIDVAEENVYWVRRYIPTSRRRWMTQLAMHAESWDQWASM